MGTLGLVHGVEDLTGVIGSPARVQREQHLAAIIADELDLVPLGNGAKARRDLGDARMTWRRVDVKWDEWCAGNRVYNGPARRDERGLADYVVIAQNSLRGSQSKGA